MISIEMLSLGNIKLGLDPCLDFFPSFDCPFYLIMKILGRFVDLIRVKIHHIDTRSNI